MHPVPRPRPVRSRRTLPLTVLATLLSLAALVPAGAAAAQRPARSVVWEALPDAAADWSRSPPDAAAPAFLPGHVDGAPEAAWRTAMAQAGDCLRGVQPAMGPRCPAPLDDARPVQKLALRMMLRHTAARTLALESADPAIAVPVRTLLRHWAGEIERWQDRLDPTAFAQQLDTQGRHLAAVHAHLTRLARLFKAQPRPAGYASEATGAALGELLRLSRRGFATDGMRTLAGVTARLADTLQTPEKPPAASNAIARRHAAWDHHRVWLPLVEAQLGSLPPRFEPAARAIAHRLKGAFRSLGERDTLPLAQWTRDIARVAQHFAWREQLETRQQDSAAFLERQRAALQQRIDHILAADLDISAAVAQWAGFMTAVADPRQDPDALAALLAHALEAPPAQAGLALPPYTALSAPDDLRRLIGALGPDGALETVLAILDLSDQLRSGLAMTQRYSPPRGVAIVARKMLTVHLEGLRVRPEDPARAYLLLRDALASAVRLLEQDMLPGARADLEKVGRMLQDMSLRSFHSRSWVSSVQPVLAMIGDNLSLRDIQRVWQIQSALSGYANVLTADPAFFERIDAYAARVDFSAPPRPADREALTERSHLSGLLRGLQGWLPSTPDRPAPRPAPPPAHDEL